MSDTQRHQAGTRRLLRPYGLTTLAVQSAPFCVWLEGAAGSVVDGTPISRFCRQGITPVGVERKLKKFISCYFYFLKFKDVFV
jgi:hypothetical protein